MNITIVIPNYNGEPLLKMNLPSVLDAAKKYKGGKVDVLITDDNSTDASAQVARDFGVSFITSEKNTGFASNVNRGVKQATGDIIVLLNTDVRPQKDFLTPLIKHFSDPAVFGVGCMDKSIENGKTVLRGRGLGKFQRGFLIHRRGEVDMNNTLWVSGGSSAFRRSVWEKLGGFNDLYSPFYWEDIDLSYRAQKSGYNVLFEKESIVVHEHEKGAIKSYFHEKQIKIIAYRNQFLFVWINITDAAYLIQHSIWLPIHILSAIIRGDSALLCGFAKALALLPKAMSSRNAAKKLFTKSDYHVLQSYK